MGRYIYSIDIISLIVASGRGNPKKVHYATLKVSDGRSEVLINLLIYLFIVIILSLFAHFLNAILFCVPSAVVLVHREWGEDGVRERP